MAKLLYKKKEIFEGISSYSDVRYTEEKLLELKEEIYNLEKGLEQKFVPYSSEYCYELGIVLGDKLKEFSIVESERYKFWAMLREYVNMKDNKKVITEKRDPYEYCYMLSKLNYELVVKFSRAKWDHLFDCITAREDDRIYSWLLKENNKFFLENSDCWKDFIKGLKVNFKNIDTSVFSDKDMSEKYSDILHKTIYLIKFMKENIKLSSKKRDEYFEKAKKISYERVEDLKAILDKITYN